jgi:FkbH-like protein
MNIIMEKQLEESKKEVKCVIWDLDNTIWEGILSESPNVTLKKNIKETIEILDSRGILNSISSKNNYEDAMEKLKEFGIAQFFLYPQINWSSKSESVKNIQKQLNIGMDTILFVDDQQFELDEVKSQCSQVTCMNSNEYESMLKKPRLNPKFITKDSKRRRLMYLENIQRNKEEESFTGPKEEFLAGLDMVFRISKATLEDLERAEELTVRTNQLNSTGITYDFDELKGFIESDDYELLVCELKDKYGSYGKIGLSLIHKQKDAWCIKLLLMSCRVVSRGVGTILLTYIMNEAKKSSVRLLADFRQTERNKMMKIAYGLSNFKEIQKYENGCILLENDLSMIQSYPNYAEIFID